MAGDSKWFEGLPPPSDRSAFVIGALSASEKID
jgi:hypothetical protein